MTEYRVNSAVLRAPVGPNEVLLHAETGLYHLIKGSGAAVLAELEAGRTLVEAAASLSETTGEDYDRVLADCEEFVDSMVKRGLIERVAH